MDYQEYIERVQQQAGLDTIEESDLVVQARAVGAVLISNSQ